MNLRGALASWAFVLGLTASISLAEQQQPTDFFVAPDGRADADGSLDHPWDLATALRGQPAILPGATIWLRGGTYSGSFVSRVAGLEDAYVTVRAYRGERPILDNGSANREATGPPLTIEGAYVVIWGLEITSSMTNRKTDVDLPAEQDLRATGISVLAPHTKLVNNIVHDTGNCVGHWSSATDSEMYGNLLYFCGWDGPKRGHGHGVYIQNSGGIKEIRDNIIFSPFGYGIHAYTGGGRIDDLRFRRNVVFNASRLSVVSPGWAGDMLIGGGRIAQRPVVDGNFTYSARGSNQLGYFAGTDGALVIDNYFVEGTSGSALGIVAQRNLSMTSNTFVGSVTESDKYPANRYETGPHGVWPFVLLNGYDRLRATIVVYNWDGADTVPVHVPALLAPGDKYQLRNVQNYFGDVIAQTYTGGPVLVPMSGRTVATPLGWTAPASTFPTFGVFVLIKQSPEGS